MKLYNSKNSKLETFKPLSKKKVGIYYCGPTVQGEPHIGHLMSAVVFDELARWLTHQGYKVEMVRNITDIDDKILAKSTKEYPWWKLAHHNEQKFNKAYSSLNIQDVSCIPHATGHIPEIIALIKKLIEKEYAYQVNGNVFFDVSSWKEYGSLTRYNIKKLKTNKTNINHKRNLLDFTLWKSSKKSEPHDSSWESPWGRGRPGWHIECSAMATKYLGENFDIHGGGLDLRFPHHENENAQAKAAGLKFANIWMHHGMVNSKSKKIGKSNGNFISLENIFKKVKPDTVRYFLSTAHYRSTLDFSIESLKNSETSLKRIKKFINRGIMLSEPLNINSEIPIAFINAMNDDLNVPQALSIIHENVKIGNLAFDSNNIERGHSLASQVLLMMNILGFQVNNNKSDNIKEHVIPYILKERANARRNRDWAKADQLRILLQNSSIIVEDGQDTTLWHTEDINDI